MRLPLAGVPVPLVVAGGVTVPGLLLPVPEERGALLTCWLPPPLPLPPLPLPPLPLPCAGPAAAAGPAACALLLLSEGAAALLFEGAAAAGCCCCVCTGAGVCDGVYTCMQDSKALMTRSFSCRTLHSSVCSVLNYLSVRTT